jgi:hypothetical protein
VEDSGVGSAFIDGIVIFLTAKPHIPKPCIPLIPHMNNIVKPLYAWFGHYIPNLCICQAHFMPKPHIKFAQICSENKENLHKNI